MKYIMSLSILAAMLARINPRLLKPDKRWLNLIMPKSEKSGFGLDTSKLAQWTHRDFANSYKEVAEKSILMMTDDLRWELWKELHEKQIFFPIVFFRMPF